MFCPGCGVQAADELRFCRQCGANLHGAREGMLSRSTGEKFDWSKTWVAEMFLTEEEKERRRGVTTQDKWLNEIKGGVVTSFAGIGAMVFLKLFLDVVANQKSPGDAEILRSVWLAGIVPFIVGLGLIFNGLFITRGILKRRERQSHPSMPAPTTIPAKTTNHLAIDPAPYNGSGVSEDTTAHLPEPVAARQAESEPVDKKM